jgi:ParB-like chromosome segregation protein Spo0J
VINTILQIDEIRWDETDPGSLTESIRVRGIAIPVRVRKTENGYECTDGRKRLSAAKILCGENEKFRRIPVMLENDYSKAGSAFWGNTQNRH